MTTTAAPVSPIATASTLLRIDGVGRSFGDVRALDGISLDIAENEFFALLGPSGCGKTTLLRSIAGFETPDEGDIWLGDVDLLELPPHRRPVNLMFQSYALFPHMTVAANIAYGLKREKLPKAEIAERVDDVLATVGLTALATRRPAQLSGGQRQRVALARAIVKRPRLLLLDEPLSALDRKVRAEMQLELKRLQHEVGITFVVVTHDQDEAMSMADRIAVLADGRVQQVATPVELYSSPTNLFVADFIGSSNLVAGRVEGSAFVSPGLGALPWSSGSAPAGEAHLVVRPEDLRLGEPGTGLIDGTVVEVQFQSGISTVVVQISENERPFLATVSGVAPQERGAAVGVSWETAVAVEDRLA